MSKYEARRLATALVALKKAGLEVNIIAHSLGNGFLLETMKILAAEHKGVVMDHVFMWEGAVPNNVFNRPSTQDGVIDRWDYKQSLDATQKVTVLHAYNDNILGPFPTEQQQKADWHKVLQAKPIVEWFSAYFCKLFNLESLYSIAMALNIEMHLVLRPDVQEVMYQYLLEQRPDLVAKLGDQQTNMQNFNDGKYLPTFEAQISCVTNSSHYAKLKTQMENSVAGFKKDWTDKQSHLHIFLQYHPFLKDILSGLYDSIIAIEKGGSVGKKILNAAGDAIAMPFTEALGLSSPASDASQLRDDVSSDHLTQKGDETFEIAVTEYRAVLEAWKLAVLIMKIISVAGVVESAIEEEGSKLVTTPDKVESWFDKLDKVKEYSGAEITIEHAIHAAYLVSMLNDKRLKDWHVPAMGYQPLDKLPRTLKAKLNYVDQTKWLYQHSGMRIPSKDLMNNIYIPYVIDAMQGFGKYPKA